MTLGLTSKKEGRVFFPAPATMGPRLCEARERRKMFVSPAMTASMPLSTD